MKRFLIIYYVFVTIEKLQNCQLVQIKCMENEKFTK